jgi:hypothetical protein
MSHRRSDYWFVSAEWTLDMGQGRDLDVGRHSRDVWTAVIAFGPSANDIERRQD